MNTDPKHCRNCGMVGSGTWCETLWGWCSFLVVFSFSASSPQWWAPVGAAGPRSAWRMEHIHIKNLHVLLFVSYREHRAYNEVILRDGKVLASVKIDAIPVPWPMRADIQIPHSFIQRLYLPPHQNLLLPVLLSILQLLLTSHFIVTWLAVVANSLFCCILLIIHVPDLLFLNLLYSSRLQSYSTNSSTLISWCISLYFIW